jgi:cardiolipin synthase
LGEMLVNIPNILSIFRLALVPVFVTVYFGGSQNSHIYATGVYVLAAVTDFLDGRIARKYNLVSKLGRILDPLGDKIMTFAVLLCITIDKLVPVWAVVIFFIKEGLMAIGGLLIYKKYTDMPPANYIGKTATVVFVVVCALLMLIDDIPKVYATAMISIAIIVMLAAFVSYLVRYIKMMQSMKQLR